MLGASRCTDTPAGGGVSTCSRTVGPGGTGSLGGGSGEASAPPCPAVEAEEGRAFRVAATSEPGWEPLGVVSANPLLPGLQPHSVREGGWVGLLEHGTTGPVPVHSGC